MKTATSDITRVCRSLAGSLIIAAAAAVAPAQGYAEIIVEPLFEYPVAPEELENLSDRCNYLMANFWSPMNFATTGTVDQNALNDAFRVYVSAMPYSSRSEVMKSVNALIKQLKGNPVLTIQFAKAAEESLYGVRAGLWSDEVYIPFLKAVTSEKGVSEIRKERYAEQLRKLQTTAPGKKAPGFRYRNSSGRYADFKPEAQYTLIEFGDPDCDDCRFSRMKLEMAPDVADMIEDISLQIFFIMPDVAPDEEAEALESLKSYPSSWISAIGYGVDDLYDLRTVPSFYLLGSKGEIIVKNRDVSGTLDVLRERVAAQKKK